MPHQPCPHASVIRQPPVARLAVPGLKMSKADSSALCLAGSVERAVEGESSTRSPSSTTRAINTSDKEPRTTRVVSYELSRTLLGSVVEAEPRRTEGTPGGKTDGKTNPILALHWLNKESAVAGTAKVRHLRRQTATETREHTASGLDTGFSEHQRESKDASSPFCSSRIS